MENHPGPEDPRLTTEILPLAYFSNKHTHSTQNKEENSDFKMGSEEKFIPNLSALLQHRYADETQHKPTFSSTDF